MATDVALNNKDHLYDNYTVGGKFSVHSVRTISLCLLIRWYI